VLPTRPLCFCRYQLINTGTGYCLTAAGTLDNANAAQSEQGLPLLLLLLLLLPPPLPCCRRYCGRLCCAAAAAAGSADVSADKLVKHVWGMHVAGTGTYSLLSADDLAGGRLFCQWCG